MLIEQELRDVTQQGVMQVTKARINASRKMFSFFSDGLYSNIQEAIIRELSANAWDSHTMAGKDDVPFEVWLPTDLDPTFRIRDRGLGMSHEFVTDGYLVYGDGSSKDSSDDAIGGFGVGKAATFGYTDQFTLRSVHDGTLSIYSVFVDELGIPSVGLLGQKPTDEENGVEISFPVESKDFQTFANEAQKVLQFFRPLPILKNGELTPPSYMAQGNGWAVTHKGDDLGVIMGGVRYPVNVSNLPWELRNDKRLSPLISYGLDIWVPLGAVVPAISREALNYNAKTIAGIRAALEATIDEIVASFATIFDDCPSWWSARKALAAQIGSGYSGRARLLTDNALYRGQKLEVGFDTSVPMSWRIDPPSRKSKKKQTGSAQWKWGNVHINPAKLHALVIDDLPVESKSKTIQRIKHRFNGTSREHAILVVRPNDHDNLQPLLDKLGNPPRADYILTSELPVPPQAPRRKYDRPKVRMFRSRAGDAIHDFRPSKYQSAYDTFPEIDYADQPSSGIMVIGENFAVPHGTWSMLDTGLVHWTEVVFVNRADALKLAKTFRTLKDVFQERLAAYVKANPDLPAKLALDNSAELETLFQVIGRQRQHLNLNTAQSKRPFGRLVALYDRYLADLTPQQRLLSPYIKAALPPRIKPAELLAAFQSDNWRTDVLLKHGAFERLTYDADKPILKLFLETI